MGGVPGQFAPGVNYRIEAHINWPEKVLEDLDKELRETLLRSQVRRKKDGLLRSVPWWVSRSQCPSWRIYRSWAESQARQLKELGRRVAKLAGPGKQPGGAERAAVDGEQTAWRPPRRGRGMPDAGVIALEVQPDEEHAFGPAAALVAEWREVRARMQDDASGDSRVERAAARVRRWELEAELLGDCHLTLPSETEPLDEYRRADQVRRRREALVEARRKLAEAKRVRMLRRVLTLGLWRR